MFLVIVLIVLGVSIGPESAQPEHPIIITDCAPDNDNIDAFSCQQRQCAWLSEAPDGAPKCQIPQDHKGYSVEAKLTATTGTLKYEGAPFYGPVVSPIAYDIHPVEANIFRFTISDAEHQRYRVPDFLVPVSVTSREDVTETNCCRIQLCTSPFGVRIWRKSTNKTMFDSCHTSDLYVSDQFLQTSTRLPSSYIYGFGEHTAHNFKRDINWRRWPMWARDEALYNHSYNLYGVQPFYLCVEDEFGNSHGVLLMNSNAMEVWLQPTPAITWRTLGGILDFFIFAGPTPQAVAEQLTSIIGRPALPPYWSLGFHLSRWGYDGTKQMEELVDRMEQNRVPLDVQWGDIDIMKHKYSFTYDSCSSYWTDLPDMVKRLKEKGIHFVPIVDPCIRNISAFENHRTSNGLCERIPYDPYVDGLDKDIFVKEKPDSSQPFLGIAWPGQCFYPDFTHPNATAYWYDQIMKYSKDIKFDGLWIAMNEPSHFNHADNYTSSEAAKCANDTWNYPKYIPKVADYETVGLFGKTMCMEAQFSGGSNYNFHSLYGHSMSKLTYEVMKQLNPKRRPFIVTRSNFVGTGSYAFHWLGDNEATWEQLKWSIVGIMEYNMFGIPMVGADICGFAGNTTEALCRRWTQLGAFYPLSRSHNSANAVPQEPVAFGEDFARMASEIIRERYRLLPYLYTLFYWSHINGTPVIRPLLMEFPADANTWNLDDQFLWGSCIMVSPVIEEGAISRDVYYPKARWFSYFNRTEHINLSGKRSLVTCDQNTILLDIRGGCIVPMQTPALSTARSRENPMQLLVALSESMAAAGSLFLDDGQTDLLSDSAYSLFTVNLTSSEQNECVRFSLRAAALHNSFNRSCFFDQIIVMGLPDRPANVLLSGAAVRNMYDPSSKVMVIDNLDVRCNKLADSQIEWRVCSGAR
ncbi:Gal mutarotas 2 and Glyco hydro 31 domain contain ing protein [Trichuris trichiura]|uniref:Maltase n=1 Tax=Trichuris trichiura TaxID=36087 RepID=A0A077Z0Q6_TRITR|nr:Gal mutarotas 2 and Glyco hydro 31 domain contain ing protein [Trichuris trichiura]